MTARRGQSSEGTRRRAGLGSAGCAAAERDAAVPAGQVVPNSSPGVGSILAESTQGPSALAAREVTAGTPLSQYSRPADDVPVPSCQAIPKCLGATPNPPCCCLSPAPGDLLFHVFFPRLAASQQRSLEESSVYHHRFPPRRRGDSLGSGMAARGQPQTPGCWHRAPGSLRVLRRSRRWLMALQGPVRCEMSRVSQPSGSHFRAVPANWVPPCQGCGLNAPGRP